MKFPSVYLKQGPITSTKTSKTVFSKVQFEIRNHPKRALLTYSFPGPSLLIIKSFKMTLCTKYLKFFLHTCQLFLRWPGDSILAKLGRICGWYLMVSSECIDNVKSWPEVNKVLCFTDKFKCRMRDINFLSLFTNYITQRVCSLSETVNGSYRKTNFSSYKE